MSAEFSMRPAMTFDLDGMMRVQSLVLSLKFCLLQIQIYNILVSAQCHGQTQIESRVGFAARMLFSPNTHLVAIDAKSGLMVGYFQAHVSVWENVCCVLCCIVLMLFVCFVRVCLQPWFSGAMLPPLALDGGASLEKTIKCETRFHCSVFFL